MRSVNPATGKPYPRSRPLDWRVTKSILRHRQAHARILAQGFVEVLEFSQFPCGGSNRGARYSEAIVHPDGSRIYVKIAPTKESTDA